MILQNLLFPKIGVCTIERLYYRVNKPMKKDKIYFDDMNGNILFNEKNLALVFDTYFNSFSIEKWNKYTKLDYLSLRLKLKGKFRVILINKEKIHEEVFESILDEVVFDSKDIEEINIEFKSFNKKGVYAFILEALEDNSIFYGGGYYTDIKEASLENITIAIDICTFGREKFIERNLRILKESILENKDSILYDKLKVYIADNGKTLNINNLSDNNINIYPNKNTGGAGGFTRGLIEILKEKEKNKITHVLLMDDDIIIEPASLEKTYNFLRLIKKEYKDVFIGGSMLRLDKQYIQVESGASWYGGAIDSLKNNLDLRKVKAVIHNEVEEYSEYNAWWYCCMPIDIIKEDNLPLPIFIRGDDVEYGLRNMKNLVTLNGICVWHEPFENKYTSFLHYYIVRNLLIDNSLHFDRYNKFKFLKFLFKRITREMSYYRYKNVDLIYKAVEDFLKGVNWIKSYDGELLHSEVMSMGYKAVKVEELNIPFSYLKYKESLDQYERKIHKLKRFVTLNGYILPARGTNIVSMALARPSNFYRVKRVLNYDVTSNKGFITEINRIQVIKNYFKFIVLAFKTIFKFNKVKSEFKDRVHELTNVEFWSKYLDI
ncbi:glycosyltransferase [Clostridioides sp. ES-S-0123-01]|uniref:glycosyltransferase n=1 Tax=Clostridioides sp. ES-S-0123-01 TaxID=2770783 RepID=UPI001D1260B4|nr:glycosyltransferase [Clostridioides sp. ES-S-0123-01]